MLCSSSQPTRPPTNIALVMFWIYCPSHRVQPKHSDDCRAVTWKPRNGVTPQRPGNSGFPNLDFRFQGFRKIRKSGFPISRSWGHLGFQVFYYNRPWVFLNRPHTHPQGQYSSCSWIKGSSPGPKVILRPSAILKQCWEFPDFRCSGFPEIRSSGIQRTGLLLVSRNQENSDVPDVW